MLYAIIATDAPDSLALRKPNRAVHLERLRALRDAGRLVLAGPHPAVDAEDPGPEGFSGSLIVAEFPSLDEAHAWAQDDPYTAAGVFATVVVKPFKQVLP